MDTNFLQGSSIVLNAERVTILIEFLCGGVDKSGSRSEIKEVHRTESTKLVFSSI